MRHHPNKMGVRDTSDNRVKVLLYNSKNEVVKESFVDSDGKARFEDVFPGKYKVVFIPQRSGMSTQDMSIRSVVEVTVRSGEDNIEVESSQGKEELNDPNTPPAASNEEVNTNDSKAQSGAPEPIELDDAASLNLIGAILLLFTTLLIGRREN
jgi:hypothetical protein